MTPRCLVQADAAFTVGQSHLDNAKPCQDYALAHTNEAGTALSWAAVADGCSTAGLTDVGARMWVHAVRRLATGPAAEGLFFGDETALRCALIAAAVPMLSAFERADARATVLAAASDGHRARAVMFGDGAIASQLRDGHLALWVVEYESNAPRYLSYEVPTASGADETSAWKAMVGSSKVHIRHRVLDAAGVLLSDELSTFPATDYPGLVLDWEDVSQLQCLLVATDGVQSFEGRDALYGVAQLLAIKNPTGQFFHRRLGAMARSWKKGTSAMPQDDLGAGLLWFKHGDLRHE